jgi:hypothetical protein
MEPGKLKWLKEFLEQNTGSPFGSRLRFRLMDFDEMDISEMKPLGTYGVIKGARQFIVGAVLNHEMAMEDFGYAMEKNILMATELELGTCWLGGTLNRGGFAERMGLTEGELLPAISPVGYARDRRSLTEKFFRLSAGSDKRKPWHELFYEGSMNTPLEDHQAGSYAAPLECVRRGPSASNKQPWRIIKENSNPIFHLYLKRTPGYDSIFGGIRMQHIDMGIAMCHFELPARELGLKGQWRRQDPQISAGNMEYIVSWIGQAV